MAPRSNTLRRSARAGFFPAVVACFLACGSDAEARETKRGYTLFRPVPEALLRDLSADRPDLTESPYTVDAGHVQVESDLIRHSRENEALVRAETWTPVSLNLKVGVDYATDLQILTEWHRFERVTRPGQPTGKREGFGDLAVRLKRNLFGNDEGPVSVALLPFVSFPTSTHGLGESSVGGGVALPVAIDAGSGWGIGLMAEGESVEDGDGEGRHFEGIMTATTGHGIAGPLAGFVEVAATFRPKAEGDWIGTVDGGVTCSLSKNAQLDGGAYVGISEDADDLTLFLGLTLRR